MWIWCQYDQELSSAYITLGFILRDIKRFKNHFTLLIFYVSVCIMHEYTFIVWSPGYNLHISCLMNIQRRFLKALNTLIFIHPEDTKDLLNNFGFNSLLKQKIIHIQNFTFYKLMNSCQIINHVLLWSLRVFDIFKFYVKKDDCRL